MTKIPPVPPQDAYDPPQDDSTRPAKNLNVTIPGEQGPGNKAQGWIQQDRATHHAMWKIGRKNSTALPLLFYMVAHLNRGSGGVVISAPTIAADLGVSVRTVQTAVNALKKCNFIQVLKSGNTNVYVINSQVAWQGERGMRHAVFNAAIKVHEQEQEKTVDELIHEAEALVPIPEMRFLGDLDPDVIDQLMPEKDGDTEDA